MAGIDYGYYSTGSSSGGTTFTDVNYKTVSGDYVAAGFFTGNASLPTSIGSIDDYHAYVDALLAKTTEVSTVDTQINFMNITHQYVGLGGAGADKLLGYSSAGSGTLLGGAGDDTVQGGAGDDVLSGGDGNDFVLGGDGNDTLDGTNASGSADRTYGGTGINTLTFAGASTAVSFDLNNMGAQAVGAGSLVAGGIQNLIGSSHADTLTGDANDNVIDGGSGDDTLVGGGGSDTLSYASAGNSVQVYLNGLDGSLDTGVGYQVATGFQNLLGSAFDDTLVGTGGDNVINGNGGNDYLDGNGGTDTVSYLGAGNGVTVSLRLQHTEQVTGVGTQTLFDFTNLTGSGYADALTGNTSANVIDALGGNDTVDGGGGDDVLTGGAGENTLSYASASLTYTGVHVSLDLQGAAQDTGVGNQTLSGFVNLIGSNSADKLTGDANDNIIDGAGDKDSILGGGGDDQLTNLNGAGQIFGGAGDDHISTSGNGAYLDGGAGADTYDFRDLITHNGRVATIGEIDAGDTVALAAAAAALGLPTFTAVSQFEHVAGDVVAVYHPGADRTLYKFDTDGDGRTDAKLVAKGGHYDFSQFTGVDRSHLSGSAHLHGDLVI